MDPCLVQIWPLIRSQEHPLLAQATTLWCENASCFQAVSLRLAENYHAVPGLTECVDSEKGLPKQVDVETIGPLVDDSSPDVRVTLG